MRSDGFITCWQNTALAAEWGAGGGYMQAFDDLEIVEHPARRPAENERLDSAWEISEREELAERKQCLRGRSVEACGSMERAE